MCEMRKANITMMKVVVCVAAPVTCRGNDRRRRSLCESAVKAAQADGTPLLGQPLAVGSTLHTHQARQAYNSGFASEHHRFPVQQAFAATQQPG